MKNMKREFGVIVAIAVLTLVGHSAPAALFSSIDGKIASNEYSLSTTDASDSGADFGGTEADIDTAYFNIEEDSGEFGLMVGFDVFGSGDIATILDQPTEISLQLFPNQPGAAPDYTIEFFYYSGAAAAAPTFTLFFDETGAMISTGDVVVAEGPDFEFGIPIALLGDIFSEGSNDFQFSLTLDQPSNNDDDVEGTFVNVIVPEPASAALLALGGSVMLAGRFSRLRGRKG